ncbi:MAG: alpha/beta hydrolase-fold protein, partial [Terracidiphilus sp.]
MNREYQKWRSERLGRDMELLIFGRAGQPVLAFPTSGGRFFDFEYRGMIAAIVEKIEADQLQLFCVDSVDTESWYNSKFPPRLRIARHIQYEQYLMNEVVPLIGQKNQDMRLLALGISFGGYHAVNIALRHPDIFTGFLSLSGTYDLSGFLDGFDSEDCRSHLPMRYLPDLS